MCPETQLSSLAPSPNSFSGINGSIVKSKELCEQNELQNNIFINYFNAAISFYCGSQ